MSLQTFIAENVKLIDSERSRILDTCPPSMVAFSWAIIKFGLSPARR